MNGQPTKLKLSASDEAGDINGVRQLMEVPSHRKGMLPARPIAKRIDRPFANFELANSHILQSFSVVNADRLVNGEEDDLSEHKRAELKD